MSGSIEQNLREVESRIAAAALRANRATDSVRLIAVTKTFPADVVNRALQAGANDIGENRVQEFRDKAPLLRGAPRCHLIGSLQTNKANDAVRLFDVIQSVDRLELAEKLNRAAASQGKTLDVLIQVNVGEEEQKGGCAESDLPALLDAVLELSALRVTGLMTIPPHVPGDSVRKFFGKLARLRDELVLSRASGAVELSMGMSEDFELAIEEGSTMVRVGRAIFGQREARA